MRFKNLPSRNHLGNASFHHWVWDCLSVTFCDCIRSALSKAGLAPAAVFLSDFKCWALRKKLRLALLCLAVGTFTAHINNMLLFLRLPHSLFLETPNTKQTPAALPCSTFPRLVLPNVFGVCYTPSSPQYNTYCVITQFVYSALDYNFCKVVV